MEKIGAIAAWDLAQKRSQRNSHTIDLKLWDDYWGKVSERYGADSMADEDFYRSVIESLRAGSAFRAWDAILDIGCGPGTYALPFAEEAGQVDALDTSSRMLAVLKKESSRRGLKNISTIEADWDKYGPSAEYDLVFSSMSPAIHDAASLLKMESCSRRSCCVVTYGEAYEYPVIRDLWGLLVGEYGNSNAYLYTYPYDVLREKGRGPAVRMFSHEYCRSQPEEEAIADYTAYFSIFTAMDRVKKDNVRDYFREKSCHGTFEYSTKMRLAAIYWNVPEAG